MDVSLNYIKIVRTIKEAILRSQYRAAASVNKEQLSLYYGIGRYVSENFRKGFWGKGAIEQISSMLQKELPGLRGFSATSIRNMRIFYEVRDYNKPIDVATYRASEEMPERLRKALPDIDELKKLL